MANESDDYCFNTSRAIADDIPALDCIRVLNGTQVRHPHAGRAISVKLPDAVPAIVPDARLPRSTVVWSRNSEELSNYFQITITDHPDFSDDPRFQAAVRERWRNGIKLIPQDWPQTS